VNSDVCPVGDAGNAGKGDDAFDEDGCDGAPFLSGADCDCESGLKKLVMAALPCAGAGFGPISRLDGGNFSVY
jgi:hypothetical protein